MFRAGNVVETSMYEENTGADTDSHCFEAVLMFLTVFWAGNVVETSVYEENTGANTDSCVVLKLCFGVSHCVSSW